jgi:hypothetical protein
MDEETVPAGFPFGTDYDQLAKSLGKAIPAQLKKVRGKLNVPRERFHLVGAGQYQWAGLQRLRNIPRSIISWKGLRHRRRREETMNAGSMRFI